MLSESEDVVAQRELEWQEEIHANRQGEMDNALLGRSLEVIEMILRD